MQSLPRDEIEQRNNVYLNLEIQFETVKRRIKRDDLSLDSVVDNAWGTLSMIDTGTGLSEVLRFNLMLRAELCLQYVLASVSDCAA